MSRQGLADAYLANADFQLNSTTCNQSFQSLFPFVLFYVYYKPTKQNDH